jgi:hypothetical protein
MKILVTNEKELMIIPMELDIAYKVNSQEAKKLPVFYEPQWLIMMFTTVHYLALF